MRIFSETKRHLQPALTWSTTDSVVGIGENGWLWFKLAAQRLQELGKGLPQAEDR